MFLKLNEHIQREDLITINKSKDREIVLDVEKVLYFTIKDIGDLLMLNSKGKNIKLLHANSQIKGALNILKIDDKVKLI